MAAFASTFREGSAALAGLRHSLRSWLELANASSDVQGAILLATHEAAANAIVHGQPESPVTVTARQDDDGGFTVEVTNHAGWKDHNGRGTTIITELMSEVSVRTSVHMRSA
jgi:anti-sigma regulatory factor (Ser/Thr protein kinase)